MTHRTLRFGFAALLAAFAPACSSPDPGDTLTDWLREVDAGELEDAVSDINAPPDGPASIAYGEARLLLTEEMQRFAARGGIDQIRILEESVNGTRGQVLYELTFRDSGVDSRKAAELIMVDGTWRVVHWDVDRTDTVVGGTPVTFGSPIRGDLIEPGEIDRYEIEIESPTMVIVETLDSTVPVAGRLTQRDGEVDVRSPGVQSDEDAFGGSHDFRIKECLRPGIYDLEVSARESHAGSYRLLVQEDRHYDDGGGVLHRGNTPVHLDATLQVEPEGRDYQAYFEFELGSPAVLAAETDFTSAALQGRLTGLNCFVDVRGEVSRFDGFRLETPVFLPGRYVLAVSAANPNYYFVDDIYDLRLSREATHDDHGDTADRATPVALGSTVTGRLEEPRDVDYFKIEVYEPVTLTAEASFHMGVIRGRLTGPDVDYVWADDNHFRIVYPVIRPTTLYLQVDSLETGDYELLVSGETLRGDDHSDAPELGTPFALGSTIEGELEEHFDVDYFAITIESPTQVVAKLYTEHLRGEGTSSEGTYLTPANMHLAGPRSLSRIRRVLGAVGRVSVDGHQTERPDDYGAYRVLRARLATPGTYDLVVKAQDNRPTRGPYTLHVADDDDHADTPDTATFVRPGFRAFSGTFELPDDVDYFRFDVESPTTLVLDLDVDGVLLRLTGPHDQTLSYVPGRHLVADEQDFLEQHLSRPGIYLLELKLRPGVERYGHHYRVEVQREEARP